MQNIMKYFSKFWAIKRNNKILKMITVKTGYLKKKNMEVRSSSTVRPSVTDYFITQKTRKNSSF